MAGNLQGYLVVQVLEVSGKNSNNESVWDDSLREAFIKIEIRGGLETVKKQTSTQPVIDSTITVEEQLHLEVQQGARELRIMLCRPRREEGKGSGIIAACGIYVQDILDFVPIDKYFDLFKPGMEGAAGGFVRVSINFLKPEEVPAAEVAQPPSSLQPPQKKKRAESRGGGFSWLKLLLAGGLAAAAAALIIKQRGKSKPGPAPQQEGNKEKKKKK